MYLVVFVTLVIGLIGIYAQILSLQAADAASRITVLASNMVIWHGAAVSMANAIVTTVTPTVPCSLTYVPPTGSGWPQCIAPSGVTYGTVTDSAYSRTTINASGEYVHLPSDFLASQIQFYSVLYREASNGQFYVATFVTPPVISTTNPAPGYLTLPPNNKLISYTVSDLLHQLSIVGIPDYDYGGVRSNGTYAVMQSPALMKGTSTIQYNMPLVGGILDTGSVAIASTTSGF